MESAVNEVICKCKHVTMVDIEKALHSHNKFEDVEKEFDEVQKITGCSTGGREAQAGARPAAADVMTK